MFVHFDELVFFPTEFNWSLNDNSGWWEDAGWPC